MRKPGPLLLAMIAVALVAGCKSRNDQVVGEWKSPEPGMYEFDKDHKYGTGAIVGTWSYSNDRVTVRHTKIVDKSIEDYIRDQMKSQGRDLNDPDTIAFVDNWLAQARNVVYILSSDGNTMTPADPTTSHTGPLTKTSDITPE